jgi:hypothetical protein
MGRVNPAAEGGGLVDFFCFLSYLLAFCDLRFCYMSAIILSHNHHMMADGR